MRSNFLKKKINLFFGNEYTFPINEFFNFSSFQGDFESGSGSGIYIFKWHYILYAEIFSWLICKEAMSHSTDFWVNFLWFCRDSEISTVNAHKIDWFCIFFVNFNTIWVKIHLNKNTQCGLVYQFRNLCCADFKTYIVISCRWSSMIADSCITFVTTQRNK